jgi:Methyltransferase domain
MPAPGQDADATLVLHLRRARSRARAAALAEICSVLREEGAKPAPGGPLSEVKGITWATLPESSVSALRATSLRLGYSERVDLVRGAESVAEARATVRWKGRDVVLLPIYDEPDAELRPFDPDRRPFLLECGDGVVRRITGYRGGGGPLERRALPVVDARLLVNLVASRRRGKLLDPFAGAGGILVEARAAGWTTLSVDIDPALRFGLAELAEEHVVGDTRELSFETKTIDAVATEPPYHPSARDAVLAAVPEISRVLRPGGRAAMLLHPDQAPSVRTAAEASGLLGELDVAIDRKGTPVVCLSWVCAGG